MKIYYFSKPIVRKPQGYNASWGYGTGKGKEYTSKEELIKEFTEMLNFDEVDTLTEKEKESIVYDNIPDYDYYTIQSESFDGYSTTIMTFKTYKECTDWIIKHTDAEYKYDGLELSIIGQRWGTNYREVE